MEEITDKTEPDPSEMKRLEDWYRHCNRGKFSWTIKEKSFLVGGGTSPLGNLKRSMGQGLEKSDVSRHEGSEPVN